jgi:hypothetical protein
MTTRGRRPEWERVVQRLEGSEAAKARLQALLATLAGRQTVAQACARLGLSEARWYALRQRVLQAALAALEPQAAGRPGRGREELDARVRLLEAELRDLRLDLQAARVREEIALVMPQLLARADRARRAARRARRRRPGSPNVVPVACGGSRGRRRSGRWGGRSGGCPGSGRRGRPSGLCGRGQ